MGRIQFRFVLLASIALFALCEAASAATAEPMDLPPDVLAKFAKLRAKTLSQNTGKKGTAADGSECGSVGIGNVFTGGRPGTSPKEVNVFITGDVINANNKCK